MPEYREKSASNFLLHTNTPVETAGLKCPPDMPPAIIKHVQNVKTMYIACPADIITLSMSSPVPRNSYMHTVNFLSLKPVSIYLSF
jgi:hypothetical protein